MKMKDGTLMKVIVYVLSTDICRVAISYEDRLHWVPHGRNAGCQDMKSV